MRELRERRSCRARREEERAAFISELVRLPQRDAGAVIVVALRADFYGRCAAYPELSRLLAENHVLVGAMQHVELRRAVLGPAERVGLQVEPELVEALVNDVQYEQTSANDRSVLNDPASSR